MPDSAVYVALNDSIIVSDIIRILKRNGIDNILVFTSQEVLLKQAWVDFPSLIITDLSEENEINNFDLAKKLWQSRSIPFIFLSNVSNERYQRLYSSTNYSFVKMPVHEDELIYNIKNILSKSSLSRSPNSRSSDFTSS